MRTHNFLFLFLIFQFTWAQIKFQSPTVTQITYLVSSNGTEIPHQNPIWVFANSNSFLITTQNNFSGKGPYPFEQNFVEPSSKKIAQFAFLSENEIFKFIDDESISKQTFEFLPETKTILGYKCKKAKTVINSNTIEIWYNDESKLKASPSILGANLGLVLEVIRNGNHSIKASEIKKEKTKLPEFLSNSSIPELEKIEYQDRIWKARFTTIPVFENQLIHWSEEFEPKEGVMRFANGTIAVKKLKFPKIEASDLVFLDLLEESNGDAYDRTGTVFLIPTDKKQSFLDGLENGAETLPIYDNGNGKKYQGVGATDNYSPLIELMRFFTPFGVKHFNDRVTLKDKVWHEVVPYRQDISSYSSLLSEKEVYLGVFIGNYDKGGHRISMNVTIHKSFGEEKETKKVVPLFNTLNVMEMAGQEYATMFNVDKGLEMEFELKEPLKNAQLRYITTGHGGWGNGDEFVPKKNTILLNGKIIFDLIPWREDCGSYRLFNPVSGNFGNGLSSSDLSRSNWCPATVTNPYIIELGNLPAGKHKIQVKIPQGEPEGTSFSSWNISGILIGN
ncbi:PNGase F N-terminal domain-containing protein [Moheibacter stercoris]|uniref:Peptide-N-glycosidase F N-terminal domain-containing protein n=1 Tax=Moheibacter stercoris TaxID=1628251 RepID=A0ABV2LSM0_9FLAO